MKKSLETTGQYTEVGEVMGHTISFWGGGEADSLEM